MIRIVLDMGLPRRAAEDLRSAGWDVEHVGELGMQTTSDQDIIARAAAEGQVIVTADQDFSRLVALSGVIQPSVIHLRLARLAWNVTVELLKKVVPGLQADLNAGCIAVVTSGGVRVRRLPIR